MTGEEVTEDTALSTDFDAVAVEVNQRHDNFNSTYSVSQPPQCGKPVESIPSVETTECKTLRSCDSQNPVYLSEMGAEECELQARQCDEDLVSRRHQLMHTEEPFINSEEEAVENDVCVHSEEGPDIQEPLELNLPLTSETCGNFHSLSESVLCTLDQIKERSDSEETERASSNSSPSQKPSEQE